MHEVKSIPPPNHNVGVNTQSSGNTPSSGNTHFGINSSKESGSEHFPRHAVEGNIYISSWSFAVPRNCVYLVVQIEDNGRMISIIAPKIFWMQCCPFIGARHLRRKQQRQFASLVANKRQELGVVSPDKCVAMDSEYGYQGDEDSMNVHGSASKGGAADQFSQTSEKVMSVLSDFHVNVFDDCITN